MNNPIHRKVTKKKRLDSVVEDKINPTCTSNNINIDAPTVRNQNLCRLTASPRNPRASKNTRETRAHKSTCESICESTVQSRFSRGGSGPGGQTHRTHGNQSKTRGRTRTSSTRTGNVKKKMRDVNVDEFDISKELFDQVMALDTGSFDADEVDVEQHVPFDSNHYADGVNALLYMRPPSSPPRNRTHDKEHQKRERSRCR